MDITKLNKAQDLQRKISKVDSYLFSLKSIAQISPPDTIHIEYIPLEERRGITSQVIDLLDEELDRLKKEFNDL